MTPDRSSSGVYDGGPPAQGELDEAEVDALWRALEALRGAEDVHTEQRTMGSKAIRWQTPAGEVSFLIEMNAGAELERLLLGLRE